MSSSSATTALYEFNAKFRSIMKITIMHDYAYEATAYSCTYSCLNPLLILN